MASFPNFNGTRSVEEEEEEEGLFSTNRK